MQGVFQKEDSIIGDAGSHCHAQPMCAAPPPIASCQGMDSVALRRERDGCHTSVDDVLTMRGTGL
jgi:hypothetical protein